MLLKKARVTSQMRIPSAHKSTSSEPSRNTVRAKQNKSFMRGLVFLIFFFFLNNVKSKQKAPNYEATNTTLRAENEILFGGKQAIQKTLY